MALFEPVELTWKGEKYVIPPNRVLKAIARIEDIITLEQLSRGSQVPLAKLAQAYGSLLRFAGATAATDDEVYEMMWGDGGSDVTVQVNMLLTLMLPKKVRTAVAERTQEAIAQAKEELKGGNGGPPETGD